MGEKFEKNNKAILYGILAGAIVFISGYGVMSIMYHYWLNSSSHLYPKLKGIYDYKASAWGDPICLPLIIGSGTAYVLHFYKHVKHKYRKIVPMIFAILGAIAGIVIQAKWIISDSTPLNWSIPEQHYFNYAGWYHAVFFVFIISIASSLFVSLIEIDIFVIANKIKNTDFYAEKDFKIYFACQFLYWFATVLFLHFNFLDDYSSALGEWQVIINSSLFWLLFLIGKKFIILRKFGELKYYLPVILSIVISTSISFSIIQNYQGINPLFLMSILMCGLMYLYNSQNRIKMLILSYFYIFFEFLCIVEIQKQITNHQIQNVILLVLAFVLVPAIVSIMDYILCEKNNRFDNKSHYKVVGLAILTNLILLLLMNFEFALRVLNELKANESIAPFWLWVQEYIAESKYPLGVFVISTLFYWYVKYTFGRVKKMEYDEPSSLKLDNFKFSQYAIYAMIYFSALMLLWYSLGYDLNFNAENINLYYLFFTVLIVAGMNILNLLFKNKRFSVISLLISYLCLTLFLFYGNHDGNFLTLFQEKVLETSNITKLFISVPISLIMIILLKKSFTYNVALLRQKNADFYIKVSAYIIAVFSSICYFMASSYVLMYINVVYVYQLCIVVMTAIILNPYVQTKVLNPNGDIGILDNNKATSGVSQDGFLFGIIILVNAVISVDVFNKFLSEKFAPMFFIIGICIALATSLCWFCIKNNREHLEKKKEYLSVLLGEAKSEEEKRTLNTQFENLQKYLKFQNTVAVLLALLYSLVFLSTIRNGDN